MRIFYLIWSVVLVSCSVKTEQPYISIVQDSTKVFERVLADKTGIHFVNELILKEDFDVFRYRNYYNGGGVGIADINNDGLSDIYLTSNMGDNKLFLNKGDWSFEDITEKAGVKGSKIWSTGVSIADVNGDGLLDIYVCNAGDIKGDNRENELFINNGDLTFTDKAKEYGLADLGFSTHAAFFDYDKDGDLDCYILNNSYRPISSLGYRNLRHERDEFGGHKLYKNDAGHFVDVSAQTGIYGSVIGFGLGVTVGDVNQDNWPDLYISNDFYERDYLYINNQDGTFHEELENRMGHISMFSMGADLADLNNDGYPEIFSTDMMPEDPYRLKTLIAFETYDVYQLRLKNGYYHQYMRNMLHKNNQDGTFTEIGTMAGVDATDWSWGALIADFNNDAYKEIFVCNGIYKDVINQDFIEFLGSSEQMQAALDGKRVNFKEFTEKMPSTKLSNYLFTRTGPWKYKNNAKAWGLDEPSFSNGAAYGDLDNDGDLDLIVNNVNQELFVYKNKSEEQSANHNLTITFEGEGKNTYGLGACVKAYVKDEIITQENMPIRGFQSSMDYKMILGVGDANVVDSLVIQWPDSRIQILTNVPVDGKLHVKNGDAKQVVKVKQKTKKTWLISKPDSSIRHIENVYNDFDRDRLQYHMLSTQGPAFTKADLNGDGLDDFYLGGSVSSAGKVYLQSINGEFKILQELKKDAESADDVDAVFFDGDRDGDLDLFVVTGGAEFTTQSLALQDYYFENKGTKSSPRFVKSENSVPRIYQSGSCVRPIDFDKDGDLDLFIGTRVIPSYYGMPCDQLILLNDGSGKFTDATSVIAPQLKSLGMVTDASWFDYDNNGFMDLLVVGEWMPVTLFLHDGKQLIKQDQIKFLHNTDGWWNRILKADVDSDGDTDFVLGNLGLNSRFRPSQDSVLHLYVNDFDKNGSIEPIFTFSVNGVDQPMALRQDLVKQMSSLKKQFLFYRDYANKSMDEIFDKKLLENATVLKFIEPRSSILINNNANGFDLKPLPLDAQLSPLYAFSFQDIDGDKLNDLIIAGNLFSVKAEIGRYDGLNGLVLKGNGKGDFISIDHRESGLYVQGEVRHIGTIRTKAGNSLVFIRNNDSLIFYKNNK